MKEVSKLDCGTRVANILPTNDPELILTASFDDLSLTCWRVYKSGKLRCVWRQEIESKDAVFDTRWFVVANLGRSRNVAVSTPEKKVATYRLRDGERIEHPVVRRMPQGPWSNVRFSRDGKWCVAAHERQTNSFQVIETESGRVVHRTAGAECAIMAEHPEGNLFATIGGAFGTHVMLFWIDDGEVHFSHVAIRSGGNLYGCRFSPDGRWLAFAGGIPPRNAAVVDLENWDQPLVLNRKVAKISPSLQRKRLFFQINEDGYSDGEQVPLCSGAEFSSSSDTFFCAANNGGIEQYGIPGFDLQETYDANGALVTSMLRPKAFSLLITADTSENLRVWSMPPQKKHRPPRSRFTNRLRELRESGRDDEIDVTLAHDGDYGS